ncbi:DEAD/DEAH box helicase [Danxiaibacter flavus]|uniref:DEAD/DEAH box helicase n=1 Tax=Danxiaibacter flavus TaxID=3049108 RepID=A0ABV3ZCL8_9BACT|nr:DEAD/DEAH box helicase [Chitinophagaceae bacterium DXS]
MAGKKEVKAALLLCPQRMETPKPLVVSLHIEKENGKTSYEDQDLDKQEVNKFYGNLAKPVKDVLVGFGSEAIWYIRDEIRQKHEKLTNISLQDFRKSEMMRHQHKLIDKLRLQGDALKWYHRIQQEDKNYTTATCTFHKQKPLLSFELTSANGTFELNAICAVSDEKFSLKDCDHFHFLLHKSGMYYLLSYKDHETLQWLKGMNVSDCADEAALAANVLSVLEKDYKIDRKGLSKGEDVELVPSSQVVLHEMNDQYLVFTPRWIYDEWIVEGAWKDRSIQTSDGNTVIIKRHAETEQRFLNFLSSLHPGFADQLTGSYSISFKEAKHKHWFLRTYHKLLEEEVDIIGMDMLKNFHYSRHKVSTKKEIIKQDEGFVTMRLNISFGKEIIPLQVMQKLLLSGQKALFLKDESLGILDDEWLSQYASVIKHGKIQKDEITVAKWIAVTERDLQEDQRILHTTLKEEWWLKMRQWQSGEDIYSVPTTVSVTLRPYQRKGYEWMRLLTEIGAGACLADDMGLGKTLQTICVLAHYIENHPDKKHVIVCPASLMYNWQFELRKFAPGIRSVVHHGVTRIADVARTTAKIIITSYNTLRSDLDMLSKIEYGVAVVDESHNIKNPSAQITKAIQQLSASVRIALSGTPVVNNTFDLYAQLNFILPGMFGSREFFRKEYADAIDKNNEEEKVAALRKMTSPFILRRTKEQVAKDLPEKIESILWCDMDAEQRTQYDQVKEQVKNSVFLDIKEKGLAESKLAVIQGMLKLRQVCNSPLLLPVGERISAESVKTNVLMDELDGLLGSHKVLVFSQFSSMLDLLADECKKKNIAYHHFDGQTAPAKRAEMVEAFQHKDSTVNLFLISLKAGNTGLTLTAADYVFIFDPWWNTAVQDQAIDRTHRIGQIRSVFAYKMACRDTIEEKILLLQEKKKKLSEDLVAAEDGFVKQLTEEDIEYLFS